MANYELIGLDEATPRLLAPTANDTGTIVGSLSVAKDISDARGRLQDQRNPLAKAIRVALTGSASVRGLQALDDADLDMGTNDFTVFVQKRITTTRPAANEILYHKHDGNIGVIITLLTTGIIRLTINAANFDSTAALPSATNVEPVIMIPVVRETSTTAGSVTFVVDGVQLGTALAIAVPAEKVTNGTFNSDIAGWTANTGGTSAWNSGKLRVERTSANTSAYQAISFSPGETRSFRATITHVTGATTDATLTLSTSTNVASPSLAVGNELLNGASGTSVLSYTSPTAQTIYLHANVYGGNGTYDFDTITSLDSATVDNASNLYLLGTSSTTTEGDYLDGGLYNRALTVAECLAHCVRGPALIDIGGSQSSFIYQSDFSAGVDLWGLATMTMTGNNDGIGGVDNCGFAACTTTGTATNVRIARGTVIPTVGKYAEITISIYRPASNTTVVGFELADNAGSAIMATTTKAITTAADTWQTFTFKGKITTTSGSQSLRLYPINAAGTRAQQNGEGLYFVNMTSKNLGVVAHWPAFNAQTNTGQLADRSGNKNHMLLPASGATIIGDRRPQVQITWENTWSGTSELQYIPGVNQAVYPAQLYLDGIVVTPSASTTAGFTIGNGSNASYYGTVSGPLTAGVPVFVPLGNRYSDGTNLKLTITPMATTTSTLAITVFGRLLGGF